MKQILSIVLLAILFTGIYTTAASAETTPRVFVEEKQLSFDADPTIVSGVTYIELRSLCTALGFRIGWKQENREASCSINEQLFTFSTNDSFYRLDGKAHTFHAKPMILKGRTMISLREVTEVFGYNVFWMNASKEIILIRPDVKREHISTFLNAYVERLHKAKKFNGAALVARNDDIVLEKGYGYADHSAKRLNTVDTQFPIASITKSMTATGILQLEEQGLLSVNDRLDTFFPELPYANKITLHHLLTHSAGLPWELTGDLKDVRLIYEPGTSQRYSNIGYILLGKVIERTSGMHYGNYMETKIFNKVGMKNSGYDINRTGNGQQAKGYEYQGNTLVSKNRDFALRGGSGSLYSTVKDLYLYDRAFYTNDLLLTGTRTKMMSPKFGDWGYGWLVFHSKDGRVTQLNGSTTGFKSFIRRNDSRNHVIILLSNHSNEKLDVIGKDLETLLY